MATPRVLSRSRFALSRGFAAPRTTFSMLRPAGTAISRQSFSLTVRAREEVVQTPATGAEVSNTWVKPPASDDQRKRSIAITKLPYSAAPADVEQLIRNAGGEVMNMQFSINRFTFASSGSAFVELGSEEQAQKAIKALNGSTHQERKLKVAPVYSTFFWDAGFRKDRREFYYDANTPSQAIQGLLDRRRYGLYVENPGWKFTDTSKKSPSTQRIEIIKKYLGPYGVEAFGTLNWKSDTRNDSTFVTLIDFVSKESAEQAVRALYGQAVEGRKIYLRPANVNAKKAEQIGKVDKSLIAKLRQHGYLVGKSSSN